MVAFVHPVRAGLSASWDAKGSGWTRSTWSSRMTRGRSSHSATSRTAIGSRFGSPSPAITVRDARSTTTLPPSEVNACKHWCVMAPDGLRGSRPMRQRVPMLRRGSLAPTRVSQRETKDVAWESEPRTCRSSTRLRWSRLDHPARLARQLVGCRLADGSTTPASPFDVNRMESFRSGEATGARGSDAEWGDDAMDEHAQGWPRTRGTPRR